MLFCLFVSISPWKRPGPFIWINPLYPIMLCAMFSWNWSSGSWKEDFFNFVNVFLLFRNYLPLDIGGALHLNKLESPSPKDTLCQVWLKLTQWFLRRRWKCEKFTTTTTTPTTTTTTTDKYWSEKLTWTFGSGELKTEYRCDFTKISRYFFTIFSNFLRCFI